MANERLTTFGCCGQVKTEKLISDVMNRHMPAHVAFYKQYFCRSTLIHVFELVGLFVVNKPVRTATHYAFRSPREIAQGSCGLKECSHISRESCLKKGRCLSAPRKGASYRAKI